ncbi:hypothetical protein [Streptomyces sp. 8L]|uniref:hypothetical protein n=1 Tax=Streptomyces sp. 8L TaxID=2877242 RepID=UPI001CD76D47|nr:hypothetical protein [Streptomyces sp. 8L]MCA1224104.1 hypothetical protein [Streptomyces sp. 8L]
MTSTTWAGPQGDQWDKLDSDLNAWAATIDWAAYQQAEEQYLQWAYKALAAVTAYACELSDEELQALEADRRAHADVYPAGKRRTWSPRYSAAKLVEHRSERIMRATQANMTQLRSFGIAARDAGLAVVAQGLIRDAAVVEYLAGPWLRRGHVFPQHVRVSWDDFPAGVQGGTE